MSTHSVQFHDKLLRKKSLNICFVELLDEFRVRAIEIRLYIQSNFNSSNTVGLFTMANSNSILRFYKILPLALDNKYSGKIFLV